MAAKKTNKSKPKRNTKDAGRSRSASGSKKAGSKSSPKKSVGKSAAKAKAKAGKKGPAKPPPTSKSKTSKKKPAAKPRPAGKKSASTKKTVAARAMPKKSTRAAATKPAPSPKGASAARAAAVTAPAAKVAPEVKPAAAPPARPPKVPSKPPEKARGRGRGDRVAYSRVGKPLAGTPVVAVRKASPAPSRPTADKPSTPRDRGREAREPGRDSGLRESTRPPAIVSLPIPVLPVPARPSVEERAKSIEERLLAQDDDFRHRYQENFDMSWIYHDSALEGVVYTYAELRAALGNEPLPVTDSSLQPTVEDIRRHKEAIEYVRDFAIKKARLPVTIDVIKKIYLILHPSEGDIKTVKYRKDIPQHRLYFHEYAPPDKIAYKVRQVVDWINDPETRKTRNGLRLAARAHYDLLRVFPFPTDSGKVCRLFMNLLLMRTGLPPAIIHSTERQRYYDALKGSASTVLSMVQEAVENALASVEKLLDEHETKTRAFVS